METFFALICYLGIPTAFAVWAGIRLIKDIKSDFREPPMSHKEVLKMYQKCKQQETPPWVQQEIQRELDNEDIVKQRGITNNQPNKADEKKTH